MNSQLLLSNIRNVLMRLEETIIFALIERAQFRRNDFIYTPAACPEVSDEESIMGFLLHETEKNHALLRRYTSPDEHPFFEDLPEPVLPRLRFDENPLARNKVNINSRIRHCYETEIIPFICLDGHDLQYGSSSVCDVNCLQALSKRIHYGKFVAESKYRADPVSFAESLKNSDKESLRRIITDPETEEQVLKRVARKAGAYGRDLNGEEKKPEMSIGIQPEKAAQIYRDWLIPMTKDVEVAYLLERGFEG